MDAAELIASIRSRDITLRLDLDQLVARPGSRLTGAELDQLREHRDEVISLLRREAAAADPVRSRRIRTHCVTCGTELPPIAWVRCPACVGSAYRHRELRREGRLIDEGRGPPAGAPHL